MSDAPGSPRAGRLATPSWLDTRLVLGVLLVLVSVVVGARVLSAADRSQLVWAADSDLAAGSTLSADDLRPVQVRLFTARDSYLPATAAPPVGYVLERAVAKDELLPRQSLVRPGDDVDLRLVTVPVLPGLTVQSVPNQAGGLSGATPERAVVLVVPPDDVESLLSAMASGRVDLVRVPTGSDVGDLAPPAEDG